MRRFTAHTSPSHTHYLTSFAMLHTYPPVKKGRNVYRTSQAKFLPVISHKNLSNNKGTKYCPVKHTRASMKALEKHMQMRIALFFLTLLLYHKKDVYVSLGSTRTQIGAGSLSLKEHAAHCSLTPELVDCIPTRKSLVDFSHSILKINASLYYDNNLTSRLPEFVNLRFDAYIEKHARNRAIAIINHVSFNKKKPMAATYLYIHTLRDVLNSFEKEIKSTKPNSERTAMLLTLKGQTCGLDKVNSRFFQKLTCKKKNETLEDAIKRMEKSLLTTDDYREGLRRALR